MAILLYTVFKAMIEILSIASNITKVFSSTWHIWFHNFVFHLTSRWILSKGEYQDISETKSTIDSVFWNWYTSFFILTRHMMDSPPTFLSGLSSFGVKISFDISYVDSISYVAEHQIL